MLLPAEFGCGHYPEPLARERLAAATGLPQQAVQVHGIVNINILIFF